MTSSASRSSLSFSAMVSPLSECSILLRREHDLDAAVLFLLKRSVGRGRFFQRNTMRDHEGGIDLALLDSFEQGTRVTMDMRLPHLEGKRLTERGAHRYLVDESAVDSGDRHGAALSARSDRFPERDRPVGFQIHALL